MFIFLGESSLQLLVKEPGHLEEVEKLIEQGINVDHTDKCGFRPLHDACLSDCIDYVKVSLINKIES